MIQWKMTYTKLLIMSEFGGCVLFGKHGNIQTRWTEEFQEELCRHQVAMRKKISFEK